MNLRVVAGSRFWLTLGLCAVALKLWLVAAQPVVAIGGAGHDDRLYLALADSILRGEWLGSYNQMTLAKGPMYSLWIAGTVVVGLPLPLANHLLYLAGCLLLVIALRPKLPSAASAGFLFLLLWWNPMTFEMPVLGRVLRQNLYTPLTLLFFAALIAFATLRHQRLIRRLGWGALAGTAGAALWLTREETIWIVPSAALLLAGAAWQSWRAGERLRPLLAPAIAGVTAASAVLGTVCALNLQHYGWFGTVEFRAPQFIAAYGALQRARSSYELPYVPVTREAREKLYAVSPAFAELRPFLEGELGTNWAAACEGFTGRPRTEREFAGGWFMWALRDAVAAAGHAPEARSALAFYQRVASEVNAACDAGLLDARPRRDSMVPPWRPRYTDQLARELPASLAYFFRFRDFSARPPPSLGWPELLQLFRDLTRWPLAPSPEAPALDRPQQQHWDSFRIDLLDRVGRALCGISAILAGAATLVWLLVPLAAWRGRRPTSLTWIATAALGAVLAVVGINTLVHVMSFPNRSPGAFAQAYPLLLLFIGLMLSEVWLWVQPRSFPPDETH